MTEEEAKNKLCPIMSGRISIVRCVGSFCMFWQLYETYAFKAKADADYKNKGYVSERSTTGYCSQGAKPDDIYKPR